MITFPLLALTWIGRLVYHAVKPRGGGESAKDALFFLFVALPLAVFFGGSFLIGSLYLILDKIALPLLGLV